MKEKDARQTEELDKLLRESYKQALEVQTRGIKLSRRLLEEWVGMLEDQASLNRRTLDGLRRLIQEQREAFRAVSEESVEAYDSFLNSLDAYQHELEEKKATSQSARENHLMLLERTGELRRGSGGLPDDFWDLPRPEDPEGLVRSAVQEDRR